VVSPLCTPDVPPLGIYTPRCRPPCPSTFWSGNKTPPRGFTGRFRSVIGSLRTLIKVPSPQPPPLLPCPLPIDSAPKGPPPYISEAEASLLQAFPLWGDFLTTFWRPPFLVSWSDSLVIREASPWVVERKRPFFSFMAMASPQEDPFLYTLPARSLCRELPSSKTHLL